MLGYFCLLSARKKKKLCKMFPRQFDYKSKEMLQTTCQVSPKLTILSLSLFTSKYKKTAMKKRASLLLPTVNNEEEQNYKDVPWTV